MATGLSNLAALYVARGRYKDAEPLFRRSLAIKEKALGPGHPSVATGLNNLAALHRALAIWEKTLGPDHPNIVKILNNMAALYGKLGKKKKAAGFLERAEAMKKRLAGRK